MNGKSKLTLLATLMLLAIIVGPMLFVQPAAAWTDPAGWYMTVPGNLHTDYYWLYPYARKSVTLGFSKFGEPIAFNETTKTGIGLQYDTRDPFANEVIPYDNWMEGWFIDIKYTHPSWGHREIWAFAMFSDFVAHGGDWQTVTGVAFDDPSRPLWQEWPPFANPGAVPAGGRKTNGKAVTDDIKVLYHGPRRFVALLHTRISDLKGTDKVDLVDLYITVVFDKVKKTVLLLKDIKCIPKLDLNVEFSERGEWDLGVAGDMASYVHFYTDHYYPENWTGGSIKAPTVWYEEDALDTCYGTEWHLDQNINDHRYALAQVISGKYVASWAVWPHPEFWTVEGRDYMLTPLSRMAEWENWELKSGHLYEVPYNLTDTWLQEDDAVGEPVIPWIIAEHDFLLNVGTPGKEQYRVVSGYSITDRHDAEDEDEDEDNVIDREIMYQLNETFNPWDLYSAVHKYTWRTVDFFTGDGLESEFDLTPPYVLLILIPDWDWYCSFAERVLVGGVLIARMGYERIDPVPAAVNEKRYCYEFIDSDTIKFWSSKDGTTYTEWKPVGVIKVLYSCTLDEEGPGTYEWIIVGRDSAAVDSSGSSMVSESFMWGGEPVYMGGLDMKDTVWGPAVPFMMVEFRPGTGTVQVRPGVYQPSRACYRDSTFKSCSGRSALRDDWCTTVPIASSNIITIGSSWANHLTEYWNEFTDAYLDVGYGEDGSVMGMYPGKIVSLSCWSKNTYKPDDPNGDGKFDDQTKGYAVISTYKDLNGTVGFIIWGWTGQDTYYGCWTLWNYVISGNILYLEERCITTIILEFDYTKHPTDACFVKVVEGLGTISECDLKSLVPSEYAGKFPPIHPDP